MFSKKWIVGLALSSCAALVSGPSQAAMIYSVDHDAVTGITTIQNSGDGLLPIRPLAPSSEWWRMDPLSLLEVDSLGNVSVLAGNAVPDPLAWKDCENETQEGDWHIKGITGEPEFWVTTKDGKEKVDRVVCNYLRKGETWQIILDDGESVEVEPEDGAGSATFVGPSDKTFHLSDPFLPSPVPRGQMAVELEYGTLSFETNADTCVTVLTPNVYVGCVPEPSTLAIWSLLGASVGVGAWRRRRKR